MIAASRVIATIDALGNRNSMGYDAASQPVSFTNALGFVSTTVFDAGGRQVASSRSTWEYDLQTSMMQPAGWSPASTRSGSPARPFSTRRTGRWPASIHSGTRIRQSMTPRVVTIANINPLGFITFQCL